MAELGARKRGPGRLLPQPRGLPGTEEGPRFQVETWSEGGLHRLLIVAQGQGLATAYLAAKDDATGVISTGSSLVEPCPSHHDRDVLGAAMSLEPATALDMVALNAFEQVSPLPTRLLDVMTARAPTDMRDARRPLHAAPARSTARKYLDELSGRSRHPGLDVDEANGREFGYHPLSNSRLLVVDDGEVLSAPGRGARPGSVTLFSGHPGHAYVDPRVVQPAVMRALSKFTQLHGGWVMRMLDAKGWSTQTYAYFSAPGPVGERRRQAARLYQALAPVIARSETIRDLVDAGRPYERALRDRIALLLPADARKDFGVGGLRRMRGLLASTDFRQIEWAATMATRMPVDWLPTTGVGWQVFHERTRGVTGRLDDLGLEWSDYASVSGPDWAAFGVLEQDGKRPASSLSTVRSLSGAADMARHCGQTLLRPLNRALGLDDEDEDFQTKIEMLAASELLFAGKGHQAVDEIQAGWHRDLHTLEAGLPGGEGDNAWPALFDRFDAGGGIHVVCLVSESELKAEGGRGADADGMMGLNHCVGSYAEQCYDGSTHVASVRVVDPTGQENRLSTVEITASGGMSDRPEISVEQHMGFANQDPSPEAQAALDAFEEAVQDGRVRLNPEAFVERSLDGFTDGNDWRGPKAAEQAFKAWRRHLPKEIARGGLEALIRKVAAYWGVDPQPALDEFLSEREAEPGPHP